MTQQRNPLLEAKNVKVTRGGRIIVDNASLALNAGELTILVGPNGAGKTTLVRAMAGIAPAQGIVQFDGSDVTQMNARKRAQSISYLPQGHEFHWPMSVANIVALGREPHADAFSRRSNLDLAAVRRVMDVTELTSMQLRIVTTLSGGERARVAIARALATEAPVIIADEPTTSLDERHRLIVMGLLQQIARRGAAVIAIVHDLALAMRFADRVALMKNGRIVANDTPHNALTPERIADVFGVAVTRVETPDGVLLVPSRAL